MIDGVRWCFVCVRSGRQLKAFVVSRSEKKASTMQARKTHTGMTQHGTRSNEDNKSTCSNLLSKQTHSTGTTITRLHSPYEETKNTADNSDTATVRIFLCLMPKVSNFHNYSAPKHLREYCQAEENPCLRNQVWSLPTTAEVNLVHHTRSEYCPHHIHSKNCNEAPPLTPLWVRVCINVAHRLPTNVVQRSTSKHTSKNHSTET